jgi:hypothetical protein
MRICTIWNQGDGLIPSQNRLRRLLNGICDGLVRELFLTDIFMSGLEWMKVEDSG